MQINAKSVSVPAPSFPRKKKVILILFYIILFGTHTKTKTKTNKKELYDFSEFLKEVFFSPRKPLKNIAVGLCFDIKSKADFTQCVHSNQGKRG